MTFRETRIAGASHLSTRFSFTLLPVSYIREPALYLFRSMTRAFFAAPRRRLFRPPVLSLISSLSLSLATPPPCSRIYSARTRHYRARCALANLRPSPRTRASITFSPLYLVFFVFFHCGALSSIMPTRALYFARGI